MITHDITHDKAPQISKAWSLFHGSSDGSSSSTSNDLRHHLSLLQYNVDKLESGPGGTTGATIKLRPKSLGIFTQGVVCKTPDDSNQLLW